LATPNGATPYTYAWSNTQTNQTAINLAPGNYTVTVSDANTCSGSASATITQPNPLAFTAASIQNTKCNGSSDGQIAVGATGGTQPYTFTWSNSIPSNDTAFNVSAGTYSVTVRDANSCSATAQHTVTQPTLVDTVSVVTKNVRCFNGNDGIITVNPTGGTGPYHYVWSHSASLTTNVATGLQAGTYNVTVFDANNCGKVVTGIQITQPANGLTLPTPTFVPVTCNGGNNGTATANPQGGAGGYEYIWSNNQTTQTATNLTAGTYTVTVEDDSLCTANGSVTVSQPQAIGITGVVTNVSCNGGNNGAIDITITNGVGTFNYTWSNTTITQDVTGLTAATYTVTVRDQTLCTASASFTVTQPNALTLGTASITNVSCFGGNNGSITANPSGGTGAYTYAWSPSAGTAQTISSLTEGAYNVTVRDANNCSITAQYTVTQPATAVAFGAATVTDVLCNGASTGSIATAVTGGTTPYTYSWSHNANLNNATASGLAAGSYTITVRDANSCSATQSNTITQPNAITFTAQPSITNVSCNGNTDGSAEVFPTGGTPPYTYTWNGTAGANPQGNLAANTYTVVITDNNACTASTQLVIAEPAAIVIDTNLTDVRCFNGTDGSIALNVTGGTPGFTYAWSNSQSTATATNLSQGTYGVTVTDSRSCTASISVLVNQPNSLAVNAQSVQVSCAGSIDGRITASALGGTQPWHYILNFSGTDITDNYTGVFNGLNSGDYIVRVEDYNNCSASTNITIGSPVADVYSISSEPTSCYGSGFTDGIIYVYGLTPINQPYKFQLDGGAEQYSNDFYNVAAGQHTVTATNYFGCVTTLPITVSAPAEGFAEILPGDTIVQVGETIQLFSFLSPYADTTINGYSWGPVAGLSCTDCANPMLTSYAREQEYTVTITYNDLCTATATMRIIVDNNLEPYVPNAFSPNGDGNNDLFMVYGEGIKAIDFKIFNRWGEKVYETTSQYGGWDGTYKGIMQNPGVYSYSVTITYLDDKEVNRKGSITLIR
jgi:gliding motility-associated-like protein